MNDTTLPRFLSRAILCATSVTSLACSSNDEGQAQASESSGAGGMGAEAGSPSAPAAESSDWTMLGYDAASTYHNTNETRISVETAPKLEVAYQLDLAGNVYSAPVMVGDRLYTGTAGGVYCLDAETGDQIWENVDNGGGSASYAYANGTLYVHHGDAVLRAYDAGDGTLKWEQPATDQAGVVGFSSPILGGDLVVVGGSTGQEVSSDPPTFRGYVHAFDAATGDSVWTTYTVGEGETGASLWSSVAFDVPGGKVYAATGNNYTEPATDTSDSILQLNMSDGAIQWKAQRYEGDVWSLAMNDLGNPDYDFGANPIVFEAEIDGQMTELVAGAQKSGDAHVLRRDTGEVVWTRKLSPGLMTGEEGIFNNGAWTGKYLLWAGNGAESDAPNGDEHTSDTNPSVLFAIDPATGDIVWERQLNGVVMAPITVANGVGFVGADQQLQAFDIETGHVLLRVDVEGTIACAPTIANGRVAFGSGMSWLFGTNGSTLTVLRIP
jgi:polyvinyl alcohol dehydrogenase (cytochrome)